MWLMISIAVLIIILAIVAIMIRKKNKTPPDYYSFFVIGLVWTPLGITMDNPVLWIMGLVFMTVGLANKDKWKKNRRCYLKKLQPMILYWLKNFLIANQKKENNYA